MSLPPLVEPGPPLRAEQVERYSRHVLLPGIGEQGQRRLAAARVLVVGAGGLGAPVLTYLAAAGVGTIGVVDDDVVDTSNLQRQVVHGTDDVGRPKVDSAVDALARLNPLVTVVPHRERLTADNALAVLGGYDLVVDGADNFPTRYLVSDACSLLGVPEVWGSVFRFDAQVSVFWAGHGPTYRDLFPEPPPPGAVPSCAEGGVLGAMVGAVGSVMATEAVKLVTGAGEPLLGRLLVLDALAMTWRTVTVRPDPHAAPVTSLADAAASCAPAPPVLGPDAVVDAPTLAGWLQAGDVDLVDVRGEDEAALVSIPGSRLVPLPRILSGEAIGELPRDRRTVLYCKSGVRSAQALQVLRGHGYDQAVHLDGGVLAWVRDVDPTLPTY
ncbi:molybdopterin-synthase adenylyltransferase MoeB [Kineosporiaceae bacterium SCSIO 59966]|nr:molybdopterin-synthase adenylyltransferase MoeB [Kineosporiaceae bacterium SCSIO 59966]